MLHFEEGSFQIRAVMENGCESTEGQVQYFFWPADGGLIPNNQMEGVSPGFLGSCYQIL